MPSLKKSERQPTFIYEMMQRLGIEPGEVMLPRLGLVYMTAFYRCQSCQVKDACRKWLDSMPCSVATLRTSVRARIFYSNWPLAGASAKELANHELVGRQVSRHSEEIGDRLERLVVPSCDATRILTLCGTVARRRPRSANTRQ